MYDLLVGADGANSVVRHELQRSNPAMQGAAPNPCCSLLPCSVRVAMCCHPKTFHGKVRTLFHGKVSRCALIAPSQLTAVDPALSAQAHIRAAAVSEEDSGREYKTWKSLPAPSGLEPEQFRGKKGRTLHLFLVRAPCRHALACADAVADLACSWLLCAAGAASGTS
jgi:2-polyprenyl-6-methoxyphenol hydroxylase-like FAD-dependent oxidoreductase